MPHLAHDISLSLLAHATFASFSSPVLRHLRQVQRLADVDEVEDVLLEAGAAESEGGLKELGTDAGVGT